MPSSALNSSTPQWVDLPLLRFCTLKSMGYSMCREAADIKHAEHVKISDLQTCMPRQPVMLQAARLVCRNHATQKYGNTNDDTVVCGHVEDTFKQVQLADGGKSPCKLNVVFRKGAYELHLAYPGRMKAGRSCFPTLHPPCP